MKLPISRYGNVTESIRFDGDTATILFEGDAQQTLDNNHRIRNGFDHRKSRRLGLELIASMDMTIAMLWLTKYGLDVNKKEHLPAILKKLNDPDWKLLKTVDEII